MGIGHDAYGNDIRYTMMTCAKCGETHQCTPANDFYKTPLWDGEGRVCERCFNKLMYSKANIKGVYGI